MSAVRDLKNKLVSLEKEILKEEREISKEQEAITSQENDLQNKLHSMNLMKERNAESVGDVLTGYQVPGRIERFAGRVGKIQHLQS